MKIRKSVAYLLFLALPLAVSAQVKVNGYLSAEFLKGQVQSDWNTGSFQNVQAGLFFTGLFGDRFNYVLELRMEDVSRFQVDQAWLGLSASNALNFKLGLYLVPFGQYNRSNRPYQTVLVRGPMSLEDVYPGRWREIGILVEGVFGSFSYAAYLGNGLAEEETLRAGQQFKDNNSNKGMGGRVGFSLGNEFGAGVSYYRGKYDTANSRQLSLLGLDASWVTDTIQVLGEYSYAKAENPSPFSSGEAKGYFIQVSLTPGKWHPFVSYQKSRYEDNFHGAGFSPSTQPGLGIFKDRNRWALGIDFILTTNVLLKAEYDFNREKNFSLKDNLFSAQIALSF
jgi:hypothetical protein